ncbi:MAG: 50S ribosomal protein L25/general stress protein Ctc, partial [Gammaproteobacteria bacterium]
MSSVFEFEVVTKAKKGTSAAKAVRRQGGVPAIIYGGGKAPEMLAIDHNEVIKHLENEAVYSHVLDIKFDGKTEKAILKGIQRHPSKPRILHMDFQRVTAKEKLRVHVPLHFIGEETSVGVKKGGIVTHNLVDVEVSCLPGDLPEFIEIDISKLDVGESLHLTDIATPKGVEIIELTHGTDHDLPVVSIASRGGPAEGEAGA